MDITTSVVELCRCFFKFDVAFFTPDRNLSFRHSLHVSVHVLFSHKVKVMGVLPRRKSCGLFPPTSLAEPHIHTDTTTGSCAQQASRKSNFFSAIKGTAKPFYSMKSQRQILHFSDYNFPCPSCDFLYKAIWAYLRMCWLWMIATIWLDKVFLYWLRKLACYKGILSYFRVNKLFMKPLILIQKRSNMTVKQNCEEMHFE